MAAIGGSTVLNVSDLPCYLQMKWMQIHAIPKNWMNTARLDQVSHNRISANMPAADVRHIEGQGMQASEESLTGLPASQLARIGPPSQRRHGPAGCMSLRSPGCKGTKRSLSSNTVTASSNMAVRRSIEWVYQLFLLAGGSNRRSACARFKRGSKGRQAPAPLRPR
jgi:hypothetical protein